MRYIHNDINPAKIANLEARIASLIAERDGIAALLTKRMSALQASLVRVRATLCDRLEKAESQLINNGKQLVTAMKEKSESDQRCLRLESDMALLAAKGAAAAQKARDGAREAVRGARREIKTFQLN